MSNNKLPKVRINKDFPNIIGRLSDIFLKDM